MKHQLIIALLVAVASAEVLPVVLPAPKQPEVSQESLSNAEKVKIASTPDFTPEILRTEEKVRVATFEASPNNNVRTYEPVVPAEAVKVAEIPATPLQPPIPNRYQPKPLVMAPPAPYQSRLDEIPLVPLRPPFGNRYRPFVREQDGPRQFEDPRLRFKVQDF